MRDDEINEGEQSEFNAAIATLMRIHEIKKYLAIATTKEELYFYYKHIKMFYKELYPMFGRVKGKDEKKESEGDYQQRRWYKAKELKFDTDDTKEKADVLNFLEEWELELRQIEQDKGMNLPKKPDARWSLARK